MRYKFKREMRMKNGEKVGRSDQQVRWCEHKPGREFQGDTRERTDADCAVGVATVSGQITHSVVVLGTLQLRECGQVC
jgi:hypothetical protein